MKVLKFVIISMLLSCATVCPSTKKLQISKKSIVTLKKEKRYTISAQEYQDRIQRICSPNIIKSATRLGVTLIKSSAIIIAAVLRSVIR